MTASSKPTATLALACALLQPLPASARWVTTWFASPQPVWGADFALPTNVPASLQRQSVRETLRISAGGRRVSVVLSNRYGAQPLEIGEVHLARSAGASTIVAGSDRVLSFGGQRAVVVAPGAVAVSDALELSVAPLEELSVTSFFPQATPLTTFHWGAQQSGYIAAGNLTGAMALPTATRLSGRAFLSAVLVDAAAATRGVVVLGDSISDGNGSTPDRNRRWPDQLAQRLAAQGVAVANAGISGARLLGDRMGANAAARFEQDVLSQPGVSSVVVLMGINDIGWPGSAFAPDQTPMQAQTLIAAYRQLIALAHAHNLRIVGATLPPFEGALRDTPITGYFNPRKELLRQEVNRWLRDGGAFDALLDFDALLRDPARPSRLLPAYDSGDHLHPGDAGYAAMADLAARSALLAR